MCAYQRVREIRTTLTTTRPACLRHLLDVIRKPLDVICRLVVRCHLNVASHWCRKFVLKPYTAINRLSGLYNGHCDQY